jgi:hypothetical protein
MFFAAPPAGVGISLFEALEGRFGLVGAVVVRLGRDGRLPSALPGALGIALAVSPL